LTPEYQADLEANLARPAPAASFYNGQARLLPGGMPRMMMPYEPMEVIITPEHHLGPGFLQHEFRRIYTDGRELAGESGAVLLRLSIGR